MISIVYFSYYNIINWKINSFLSSYYSLFLYKSFGNLIDLSMNKLDHTICEM